MPSGAGHDAMKLHEVMPQAMLFVRGQNAGISHNPLESTTSDDMQLAWTLFPTCSTTWRPPPENLPMTDPTTHSTPGSMPISTSRSFSCRS
jgi:hypothetical protein